MLFIAGLCPSELLICSDASSSEFTQRHDEQDLNAIFKVSDHEKVAIVQVAGDKGLGFGGFSRPKLRYILGLSAVSTVLHTKPTACQLGAVRGHFLTNFRTDCAASSQFAKPPKAQHP